MINKAILVGNLGKDPELKNTNGGGQVATFSIATTERWKGQDGQMQEQTDWHNIVVWNRLAEICAQYLSKGSRVYIEGKIQTRTWEKDGQTHYRTEIVAREMKMLSGKKEGGSGGHGSGGYGSGGQSSYQNSFPGFGGSSTGDDVPF